MEHVYRHLHIEIAKFFCEVFGIDIHWIIILVVVIIVLFNLCRYVYRFSKNTKELSTKKVVSQTDLAKTKEEHCEKMSLEEAIKLFDETFGEKDDDNTGTQARCDVAWPI